MARPLRLEYAGAVWYVIGQSLPRRELFRDDVDRGEFLASLGKVVAMFRWRVCGYVLLRNQYQLILETPEPNLSRGMRQLNGVYTQYHNRRHGKSGAVLHGRYKSMLVEREAHLVDLARFIAWLPVREGLSRSLGDWRWSSYRPAAGISSGPHWLDIAPLVGEFGRSKKRAQDRFRAFVTGGKTSGYDPAKHVRGQIFLGSDDFKERSTRLAFGTAGAGRATPRITGIRRPSMIGILKAAGEVYGVTPRQLRTARRGPARKAVAYLARREGALRLPEIGKALGIREFSASHLASEGEKLYLTETEFRRDVDRVRTRLGLV